MRTVLFLTGPMTGVPDANRGSFVEAEHDLHHAGYITINPYSLFAELTKQGQSHDEVYRLTQRHCVRLLTHADGIATLPGYENSRGARLAISIAEVIDIPVLPVARWLERADVTVHEEPLLPH